MKVKQCLCVWTYFAVGRGTFQVKVSKSDRQMHLSFDYQAVFHVLNEHAVSYLLIGGLNYFLRHRPVSTQDIDVFVDSSRDNLTRCETALAALGAQWGRVDAEWTLTSEKPAGWLSGQSVFCLLTPHAPLDIFFSVPGITSFAAAAANAVTIVTNDGTKVQCISTEDLLACQLALPENLRRLDRVRHLLELQANE
jgi:hypothetical protein